jgi:hypothetical protein
MLKLQPCYLNVLRITDFGNILVAKLWRVKRMEPTLASHTFWKNPYFSSRWSEWSRPPSPLSIHTVRHCRKHMAEKNRGNVSLAWQWVNNRTHSASTVSYALESTHKSISVRSTSVLQCQGTSSRPFVLTLLSSDLITSVQTFLSLHVALHLKYCKISDSDLLHLYDVSCPSDDFTPYHADCYKMRNKKI